MTITFLISLDPKLQTLLAQLAAAVEADSEQLIRVESAVTALQAAVAQIQTAIQTNQQRTEKHMADQDAAIAAFQDSVNKQLTALGSALDNVAADEANLLKQITDLKAAAGELTPANQAALDGIVTSLTAMATKSQAIADSVPDVPPPAA